MIQLFCSTMEGEIELDFLLKECSPTACLYTVTEASRNSGKTESVLLVDDVQAAGLATPCAGGLAAACPGSGWKISFGSEDSSEVYPCNCWNLSSRQKRKESGTFSSEGHSPDSGYDT